MPYDLQMIDTIYNQIRASREESSEEVFLLPKFLSPHLSLEE